ARRLVRAWQLPRWLAVTVSYLGLPAEPAQALGAEEDLFRVGQLAVGLIQEHGLGLGLAVGAGPAGAASLLGLGPEDLDEIRATIPRLAAEIENRQADFENPYEVRLLPDLLRLAAENRAQCPATALERLEGDVDALHQAFREQRAGEARRLQAL